MKIGIDARLIEETGVGRYIRNLISEIALLDTKNYYVIYLIKKSFDAFVLPNSRWEKRLADVHWHTIKEQFVMPWLFIKDKLNILHVPYFNAPIFYPGKYILTIHDLTILHFATGKASTLHPLLYALKQLMYRIILTAGLLRALHIIAVSKAVKNDIISSFSMRVDKISVTYEGIDKQLRIENGKWRMKQLKNRKYFLYVGNAYPHKNLEFLINVFCEWKKSDTHANQCRLVLAGKNDYFYNRLKAYVGQTSCADSILFLHNIDDQKLAFLYRNAQAFVFPTLAEGFGLPALEAISNDCPVIASDLPVFHELLGNIATYVSGNDKDKWINAFNQALLTKKKINISQNFPQYSWMKMAKETLNIYESCVRV